MNNRDSRGKRYDETPSSPSAKVSIFDDGGAKPWSEFSDRAILKAAVAARPASPVFQVTGSMESLESKVAYLHSRLSFLEERLLVVLRSRGPERDENDTAYIDGSVPVSARLNSIGLSIQATSDRLDSVLSRLEL